MEKLEKVSGQSMDVVADNIAMLKELFPEILTENKIDFDALRSLLGEAVETEEERYSFNWHGKSDARLIAQAPSAATLRPSKGDSQDWERSKNLFIEGDNLEVLKLLQKSYHNKVKMIYIDPPYNTGRDFVYKDNFSNNLKNYLDLTGQSSDGKKLTSNPEASGRFHTDWLNMIYPRLKLARNLLREDGVIFISIGENELSNLVGVCNQIFGEDAALGLACRVAKKSNNKGDHWSPNFDYIVTYAKNKSVCSPFSGGANIKAYDQIETEGDRKGERYQLVRLYMSTIENRNPDQRFWIECPDGSFVIPPGETFPPERPKLGDGIWRWSRKKFEAEKDRIVIKSVKSSNLVDKNNQPAKWNVFTKTYLKDVLENATSKPNNLVENFINQIASHEMTALGVPFDYPKPTGLVKHLSEICQCKENDIVMDFFAGSGTTGHAVSLFNAQYGSSLNYILVQLPEVLDSEDANQKLAVEFCKSLNKPLNIAELTKERLRRAVKKIKEQNPDYQGDLGFKVFKLDSSNLKPWDADFDSLANDLAEAADIIKADRSNEDVLFEILLKYGLDLTLPIETHQIAGKTVYEVGAGALIVCLDDGITEAVAEAIGKLKETLAPEVMRVVFKDSSFANDAAKVNAVQVLKQYGIEDVKAI